MHQCQRLACQRWATVLGLSLWMTAAMAATGATPTAQAGELAGEGPYSRFIVKYRDGSPPAEHQHRVPARLDATAARSGVAGAGPGEPLGLQWQLRMSVGGDVFTTARPLDRQDATRLMQQFAADPEVEYIEVDGLATIQQRG